MAGGLVLAATILLLVLIGGAPDRDDPNAAAYSDDWGAFRAAIRRIRSTLTRYFTATVRPVRKQPHD